MTIQNDDVLLVNQGSTSKKVKYQTLKNQVVDGIVSFPEAPQDGEQYVRQDGAWEQVDIPAVYGDAQVEALLKTNTANIGQVLGWDGDINKFKWVANSGSGTGGDVTTMPYTYPTGQQRSVQSRLEDYVSVEDFGAVPNDASLRDENTTAFQAAIDTGRAVYVPEGTYVLNGTLNFSGKNVTIIGEGEAVTQLFFQNVGDGIVVDITGNKRCRIEGLKITNANSGGTPGTAIKIKQDGTNGVVYNYAVINNVHIDQDWTKGIEFDKISQIKVNNLVAFLNNAPSILHLKEGCLDSSFENMHIGVGSDGSNDAIGMLIDGVAGDGNEGIRVSNSTFLKPNVGIKYDGGTFEPHLDVGNCHFNCQTNGIILKDAGQSFIHHNLFYAWISSSTTASEFKDATIVLVTGSRGGEDVVISDNVFHALGRPNSVTDTGIEWNVASTISTCAVIANNVFTGERYGIKTTADVQFLTCTNNRFASNIDAANQFFVASGNVADVSLTLDPTKGPSGKFTQNIRSLGTLGRQVEINLENNDRHFYIKQNQLGGAELYYEDALTFYTDQGTQPPTEAVVFANNGTAIFRENCEVHKNFYLKSPNGTLFHVKVDDNGNLSASS